MSEGLVVGGWTAHEIVGKTVFSTVYRATRPGAPEAALKIVNPREGIDAALPDLARLREVHHPNLATLLDFGRTEDTGQLFLVTELVRGHTLAHLLEAGPLSPADAALAARGLAGALGAAHAAGIVHRDVKSSNVLVPDAGGLAECKLVDFGLAGRLGPEGLTRGGEVIGTPRYMAPEQVVGDPQGPATDIWSLGVLLYEMVFGQTPFAAELASQAVVRIVTEAPRFPHDGAGLQPIIECALAKKPAERFASMDELAAALAAWQELPDKEVPPPTPPSKAPIGDEIVRPPAPERAPRSDALLLAAAAMAGVFSLTLVMVGQSGPVSPVVRWLVAFAVAGAAGAVTLLLLQRAGRRTRKQSAPVPSPRRRADGATELSDSLKVTVDRLIGAHADPSAELMGQSIKLAFRDYARAQTPSDRIAALDVTVRLLELMEARLRKEPAPDPWYVRYEKMIALGVAVTGLVAAWVGIIPKIFPHPSLSIGNCPHAAVAPGETITLHPSWSRGRDDALDLEYLWSVDGREAARQLTLAWTAPAQEAGARRSYLIEVHTAPSESGPGARCYIEVRN